MFGLQKSNFLVVCIALLTVLYGFHLRYVTVLRTVVDDPVRADAFDYYQYANNIRDFGIYSRQVITESTDLSTVKPDALRSPGFPFFSSLWLGESVLRSVKNTIVTQTILQVIAFLLLSFVFYKELGRYWFLPVLIFLWTFPHFISINTYYLSESLFTSLLAVAVVFIWFASNTKNLEYWLYAMGGLAIGLATLVRPVLEYLPLFSLLFFLVVDKRYAKIFIVIFLAGLLPVVFWKIRNLLVIGVTSDPTLMINGIYHGSFPNFMYQGNPESYGIPYRYDPRSEEVYNGIGSTVGLVWERLWDSPANYFYWYLIGKVKFLWQWDIVAGQGRIFIYPVLYSPYYELGDMQVSYAFHRILHYLWVPFALVSTLFLLLKYWLNKNYNLFWGFLAVVILYATLVHMVLAPFPRYGIPFKLLLFPIAIYVIKELVLWIKTKLKPQ